VSDKTPNDYRQLLETGRWFEKLPEAFKDALLGAGTLRQLARGERLFSRGDPPGGIYAMLDGAIAVSGLEPGGKEALLVISEPPSWFGEIAVFDGRPRTHDAVADGGPALLLWVQQDALVDVLEAQPQWWRELALLMASKLRLTFLAMEENALFPAATRLARRLVLIAERYGEWRDRTSRVLDVRQEQLAMMLSISRQTANQVLKDLEADGVIAISYGEIEILDIDGLRRRAGIEN
jgi:CRP-like cAMP-binding protein